MPISLHFQDDQQERTSKSVRLSIVVCANCSPCLWLRLFYLQVVQGETNLRLSKENGMQLRVIKAPRGLIFDRNGAVLARNPSFLRHLHCFPTRWKKASEGHQQPDKNPGQQRQAVFDSLELVQQMREAQRRRFDPAAAQGGRLHGARLHHRGAFHGSCPASWWKRSPGASTRWEARRSTWWGT